MLRTLDFRDINTFNEFTKNSDFRFFSSASSDNSKSKIDGRSVKQQSKIIHDQELRNQSNFKFHLDRFQQPYLSGVDSYYYLNQVEDLIKYNSYSTNQLVNFYKLIYLASKPILHKPVKFVLYYAPLIFMLVSVLVVYISALKLTNQNVAFLLSLLLATSSSFYINTKIGLIDHNGAYIMTLCLMIYASLGLLSGQSNKLLSIFIILFSLWFTSTFWYSWYLLLIIPVLLSICSCLNIQNQPLKISLLIVGLLITSYAFYLFFNSGYFEIVAAKLGFIEQDQTNRYFNTKELFSLNLVSFIKLEPVILLIAIAFILCGVYKRKSHLGIFFILLTLSFFALAVMFRRLSVFVVISGLFLIPIMTTTWPNKSIINKFHSTVLIIILAVQLFNLLALASIRPKMNDASYRNYQIIKKITPENAIIVSWWDNGYYINNISQRTSYVSPASNNEARLSLVANLFYNPSDEIANKILSSYCETGTHKSTADKNQVTANCNLPLYLFIDAQFEDFHPVMSKFVESKNNQPPLNDTFIKDVFECTKDSENLICDKFKLKLQPQPSLISNDNTISELVISSRKAINRIPISNSGNKLILKRHDEGYILIEVDLSIEETFIFHVLLYGQSPSPKFKIAYQDELFSRAILLKYEPNQAQ